MSDKKNIGVVEYFNADSTSFYCGFVKIKFTSQFDYIKSRGKSFRAFIKNPCSEIFQEGETVCFNLAENETTAKNHLLEVKNIRKVVDDDLLCKNFVLQEKNYSVIRKMLFAEVNASLREKFFERIELSPDFLFCEWILKDLVNSENIASYVEKCLEHYKKNPEPRLAVIIKNFVSENNLPTSNFDFPTDINFWQILSIEKQLELFFTGKCSLKDTAIQNWFNANVVTSSGILNSSVQKGLELVCQSEENFNEFIYNCITRAKHSDEKYLSVWKIFVLNGSKQLSAEIFMSIWDEIEATQKFSLLQRAMKNFSDEDCENLFEKFIKDDYEFIFHGKIDDEVEFSRRFSHCIKKSVYKVQCAEFLLNNLELFKIVDAGDDITLFLLYTLAKENAELDLLREIWKIFKYTKKVDTMSPKIRVAFLIFEAGCSKMANKSPRENIKKVEQIFLNNFMLDPNDPEKFPDFRYIFPTCGKTRKVGENQEVKILFCEARKWFKPECKVVNKDNVQAYYSQQPEFEEVGYSYRAYHSGNPEWIETFIETNQQVEKLVEVNYCPPQRGYDKDCAHVDAKFDLPVEKWTIIELAEKFNLTEDVKEVLSYRINIKSVGECFNYIGATYNRLFELREHLKCRECGEYMKPVNPPKFKAVSNLEELIYKAHHAIFGATVFQCETVKCPDNDPKKQVYLSHCWNCHSLIDSRDNKVTLANPHPVIPLESEENDEQKVNDKFKFYSCTVCGAGYQDLHSKGEKYAVFPGTLCPNCLKCYKCGSQNFTIIHDEEKKVCYLQCEKCGKKMIAPLTFEDKTKSKKAITRKYVCKKCGHQIEFKTSRLKNLMEPYKYRDIDWARW